jgi:hypothetical protein
VHADFPFKDSGGAGYGANATPKLFNIDRHDGSTNAGEVVTTNLGGQGHITGYRLVQQGGGLDFATIKRSRATPNSGSDYQYQSAVDTGSPASPSTMTQYRQRYGHFNSDLIAPSFASVTGSSRWSALGVPRSDEAGALWNPPGSEKRMVVTIEIDRPGDRIRYWTSIYGQAPVLTLDTALDQAYSGAAGILNRDAVGNTGSGPAGTNTGYPGFQLTLFITDNQNAAGSSQPTTYVDYLEIIASNSPIPHPGGFALPGV